MQPARLNDGSPCVLLAPEAEQDLRDIYAYMIDHAGQEQAHAILGRLEAAILSLELATARFMNTRGASYTSRWKRQCMSTGYSIPAEMWPDSLRRSASASG